jgi:DNA-binding GntR family transcriptional regulator
MLHEEIVGRLRGLLVDGRIRPGERIAERELCDSFGISRTPLREALKVLAAEGHVVLLPNRGARAARLTRRDIAELFAVFAALESLAGELACQRITDPEVEEIAALHRRMQEACERDDLAAYYDCNRQIHEAIVRAADNRVLALLYETVSARVRRARYAAPMPPENWRAAMRDHEAILNALVRRDGPVLALVLRGHLRNKAAEVEQAGFAQVGEAIQAAAG